MTFRGKVYESILDTIGQTPLVKAPNLTAKYHLKATLLLKLEFFNPGASVKDRIAAAMIEDAEQKNVLKKGATIIEPTSGNTGIGLAMVCAAKGYDLILTMPESMSFERRKMLKLLGARLVLTSKEGGMNEAIEKANELAQDMDNSFIPSQFSNPANPDIHTKTTALEIWEDTKGAVDIFVAGVGTGGTFSGCAQILKEKNPDIQCYAVEPSESPVISGKDPAPHKIQGIGPGFIPDNLNTDYLDGILTVSSDEAYGMTLEVAKTEGIPVGISSGAAIKAAFELALADENSGKTIVVIVPSFAERYLSTPLFDFCKEE